jgi:hypothetical protein
LRHVIWNKTGNPTTYVSSRLGIARVQLRAALHKIKSGAGLKGVDDVVIYNNGDVTDSNDEEIGNIYDEI